MRASSHFLGPLFLITGYYGLLVAMLWLLVHWFPQLSTVLPFGGLDALSENGTGRLEVITDFQNESFLRGFDALTLAIAIYAGARIQPGRDRRSGSVSLYPD